MKYMLINPIFIEAPIKITNKQVISEIDREFRESLNTKIGRAVFIKVDKLIYKLILEEKSEKEFKFRLESNIYV